MKKSFTLIELLIVLVIIGIMTLLALPRFEAYIYNMHGAEAMHNLRPLASSVWDYYMESKTLPLQDEDAMPGVFDLKPPQNSQYWDYKYECMGTPGVYLATISAYHKAPTSDYIEAAPVGGIVEYSVIIDKTPPSGSGAKPLGDGYFIRFEKVKKISQPSGRRIIKEW